jgi:hypothetical protein
MKNSLIGFLLMSIATSAFADFNGAWKGPVQFISNGRLVGECRALFNVIQTATELKVPGGGGINCGMFGVGFIGSFEIRGQELWDKNQKVGHVTSDTVYAEVKLPNGNYRVIDLALSSDGLSVNFDLVLHDRAQGTGEFLGVLEKQK